MTADEIRAEIRNLPTLSAEQAQVFQLGAQTEIAAQLATLNATLERLAKAVVSMDTTLQSQSKGSTYRQTRPVDWERKAR